MTTEHEGKFHGSTRRDAAFIARGYTYWKEATAAFRKHQASDCHKQATELVVITRQVDQDVGELLSAAHQQEKKTNRAMFLKVLGCIRFLARQGLALRGDGENESNLMQLLRFQCVDCPDLSNWLSKKTNKFVSHDIQNEILKLMALTVLRKVCAKIRDNKWYSIMADECTDLSNKEQFTLCIRSVDENLEEREDFIGLYEMAAINSKSLLAAIKDMLVRINLSLSECCGQCFDGASNMTGSRTGVATQITREESQALFLHCFTHSLNLAVSDTMKNSTVCQAALEIAFEVSKLVNYSPKREAAFDRIKSSNEENSFAGGVRSFFPTRWTVRGASIESILENYQVLQQLWDECFEGRMDPEVKGRIIGVKEQMCRYHILFGLKLCCRVLKITDNLSRTLQSRSLSAAESYGLAK